MSIGNNNGYVRSSFINDQSEPPVIDDVDVPATVAQFSVQINHGNSGSTTNVVRPNIRRLICSFGKTTSITGIRRQSSGNKQLISIIAVMLLVMCTFILLFNLSTSRKCESELCESDPNVCLTEECIKTVAMYY